MSEISGLQTAKVMATEVINFQVPGNVSSGCHVLDTSNASKISIQSKQSHRLEKINPCSENLSLYGVFLQSFPAHLPPY